MSFEIQVHRLKSNEFPLDLLNQYGSIWASRPRCFSTTNHNSFNKIMKNLLLILGVLSIGLFSSCGGGAEEAHDHADEECCSDTGTCCKTEEGASEEPSE